MRHFSRSTLLDGARPWVKTLESLRTYLAANVGGPNAFSLPTMSLPPTIRTQTHPLSGMDANLTVAHLYSAASTVFRYEGGGDKPFAGGNFRRFPTETFAATGGNLSDGENAASWQVRFVADAAKVSFRLLGSTLRYRFIVDGQYVSRTGTLTSVNTGTEYITLDFGTKAARTIVVEGEQGTAFGGVYVAPGDTVSRPAASPYRMMVLGDSITVSTGATVFGDGFVPVTAGYLGISDRWLNGPGGTGYVSKGAGSAFFSLPERISQDMTRFKAFGSTDIIVVAAGINDIGLAGVQAAANSVFNAIRSVAPNALVFVVGPWDSGAPSAPSANYLATKAAIQAAVSGRGGFWFLDPQGRAYSKTDSVHPDTNGHLILGQWLASQIRDAIASAVLWYDAPSYADLSAAYDFNNDRGFLPPLGPELVVNGNFSSGSSDWVVTNFTMADGTPRKVTSGQTASAIQQNPSVYSPGSLCVLTYTVSGRTAGNAAIYVRGGLIASPVTNGTFTVYFTCPNNVSAPNEGASLIYGTTFDGTVDELSIREVILTHGGQALGPNILPGSGNNLSTGTGTANYVGGTLSITGSDASNSGAYEFPLITEPGASYRVCFTADAGVYVGLWDNAGTNAALGGTPATRSGFSVIEFRANDATTFLAFLSQATRTITGISVQKLPSTGAYPKRSATFSEWFAFTAASDTARSYVGLDGTRRNDLAAHSPRFDWRNGKRQLRLEDARTTIFANPMLTGAVAGAIGSGGSFPTGLGQGGKDAQLTTATRTIVGSGSYKGLPYFDIKYDVVASSPGRLFDVFQGRSSLTLAAGTSYAWRFNVRALEMTGPVAPGIFWNVVHYNASDVVTSELYQTSVPLTGADQVIEASATAPALTTKGEARWSVHFSSAGTYSLTLRIFGHQGEVGSFSSDFIFGTGPTTRAIETARFSPLLEAVLQRAAGSVVVRGRLDYFTGDTYSTAQRLISGINPDASINTAATSRRMGSWNGTTLLTTPSDAPAPVTEPFGAAWAADSAGRSLAMAGTVASDTEPKSAYDLTQVHLARPNTTPSNNPSYAAGLYDFVGISPERLPNSTLQALAVAA